MFDKWKSMVAMLVVGALAGWGIWNVTSKPFAQNVITTAPTVAASQSSPDTTSAPFTSTPENLVDEGATMPPSTPKVAHLVGQPAPALNIRDKSLWVNTDRALDINDYKGQVLLLEFFRINCSHCNTAAPYMVALNQKFGLQGLNIVGVQSPIQREPHENNWRAVQDVVKNLWGVTFPVAFDKGSAVMSRYYKGNRTIMTWPTLLLIGRDGKVVYGHTGHSPVTEASLYQAIQLELGKK